MFNILAWIALAFAGFYVVVVILTLAKVSTAMKFFLIFFAVCFVILLFAELKKNGFGGYFRDQKEKRLKKDFDDGAPATQEELLKTLASAAVGGVVRFGAYNWKVLDVRARKTLLITENVISRRPYHTTHNLDGAVWAKSQIRKYLNGTFFNEFSLVEQSLILETVNQNPLMKQHGANEVSPDTTDRIFLLSKEEFLSYTKSGVLPAPDVESDTYAYCFWLRAPMRVFMPEAAVAEWKKKSVRQGSGKQSFMVVEPAAGSWNSYNKCGLRPVMWVKTK